MECSRQEYWSGLPFHFLGALSDPGMKPGSSTMQADSLLSEPPERSIYIYIYSFVPLGTGQNVHFLLVSFAYSLMACFLLLKCVVILDM